MKRILCFLMCLVQTALLFSCGRNLQKDRETLCSYYWESAYDIMQFTDDGRILRNFETPSESDSYYKLSDGKILMYTEDAIADGLVFEYRLEDKKLYIGDVEYTRYRKVGETTDKEAADTENGSVSAE